MVYKPSSCGSLKNILRCWECSQVTFLISCFHLNNNTLSSLTLYVLDHVDRFCIRQISVSYSDITNSSRITVINTIDVYFSVRDQELAQGRWLPPFLDVLSKCLSQWLQPGKRTWSARHWLLLLPLIFHWTEQAHHHTKPHAWGTCNLPVFFRKGPELKIW